MLNYELAMGLIKSGAIKENTEFTVLFNGTNIDGADNVLRVGRFHLKEVSATKTTVFLNTFGEGRWNKFTHKDVIDIDGMTPARFAEFHGFYADGREKKKHRRRGRRTNEEMAMMIAEQEDQIMMMRIDQDDAT